MNTPTQTSFNSKDTTNSPNGNGVAEKNTRPDIPRDKDGNPDWQAMTAEQIAEHMPQYVGVESVARLARRVIQQADKDIKSLNDKIEKTTDPNKFMKMHGEIQKATATRDKYASVLDMLGMSEDVAESDGDRYKRLKQENTSRIAALFPEGLPDVRAVVLADIASGKKIRWFDKTTNGAVTSKGLAAHLGLSGSKEERNRRFGMLSNDAPTPEVYAEELSERLRNMGIRFDETELLDAVLDAYQEVGSRRDAWAALERLAAEPESRDNMDYEEYQSMRAHEREMRELRDERNRMETIVVSEETDDNGLPLLKSSDGTIDFGFIETKPIRLSIGFDKIDKDGNHIGYGYEHIEAKHGNELKKAGFEDTLDFIEDVATRFTSIKEGRKRKSGKPTYILEYDDGHSNLLFIELSAQDNYWTINSGGVYRRDYTKNKNSVESLPALETSTATVDEGVQEQGGNPLSGNSPSTEFYGKDTTILPNANTWAEKNAASLPDISYFEDKDVVLRNGRTGKVTRINEDGTYRFEPFGREAHDIAPEDILETYDVPFSRGMEAPKNIDPEHYSMLIDLIEESVGKGNVVTDPAEVQRVYEQIASSAAEIRTREVADANRRYNEQLDKFANNTIKSGEQISVGTPSPILLASGLKNLNMEITQRTLREHLEKHGLTVDDIRNLPEALESPMMVYEWGSKAKSHIIITNIPRGDERITIAVRVKGGKNKSVINSVSSVHGKSTEHLLDDMRKDDDFGKNKLKWVDKEQARNWLAGGSVGPSEPVSGLGDTAKVIENFENPKITPEIIRQAIVYHGSPADFDRFDHSFMGTGEGAQAFGWGTYVTEVKSIGRVYAVGNTRAKVNISLEELNQRLFHNDLWYYITPERRQELFNNVRNEIRDASRNTADARLIIERNIDKNESYVERNKDSDNPYDRVVAAEKMDELEIYKVLKDSDIDISRHLYTVDIPDDNGSNYLRWDDRYTPEQVEELISNLPEADRKKFMAAVEDYGRYNGQDIRGEVLYDGLSRMYGGLHENPRKASMALRDAGLVGISYPANATTGGREDGARNYVIFDENNLRIVEHERFLKTPSGEVYGFTVNGKIYLDSSHMNANTPVHEYAELWWQVVRDENRPLIERGIELMKETKVWEEVNRDPNYRTLSEDARASETYARIVADLFEKKFDSITDKATLLGKLKKWIREVWNSLKATFSRWTNKDLGSLTADKFAHMSLRDLIEGVDLSKYTKDKYDRKTLAGVHNLSESNLAHVAKMGGIANPSVGVIDVDKTRFDSFGEISLIAPKGLIASRTGRNVGTWSADAFTPRYPFANIVREIPDDARAKVEDMFAEAGVPDMGRKFLADIEYNGNRYIAGDPRLMYIFLRGKGIDVTQRTESKYDEATRRQFVQMFDAEKWHNDFSKMSDEQRRFLTDAYLKKVGPAINERFKTLAFEDDGLLKNNYLRSIFGELAADVRDAGAISEYATTAAAQKYIEENNLADEFAKYAADLYDSLDISESIFNGFTPAGNRIHLSHTLENVSKIMRQQGRAGSEGFEDMGAARARLAPVFKTLEEIRAGKERIVSKEEYKEAEQELEKEYNNLLKAVSFEPYDTAADARLSEALVEKNPRAYLKKEYNLAISDEEARIKALAHALSMMPAEYFETKFERPVSLNEFIGAVIPANATEQTRRILDEAGIPYRTYQDADSRAEVIREFSGDLDNARFMIGGEDGEKSLSFDDAQAFIDEMERNADIAPDVDLTIENWDALFGVDGKVITPIGEVKMGENQFTKLMRQGRAGKLGMIKPTLENPHIIVEDKSEAKPGEPANRNSSYVFIRSFKKADGTRYYYFTSVTVSKDRKEVVISNQEKSKKRISNLLQKGTINWINKNVQSASEAQSRKSVSLDDSWTATNADNNTAPLGVNSSELSSYDKDTTNSPNGNTLSEKIARAEAETEHSEIYPRSPNEISISRRAASLWTSYCFAPSR